MENRFGITKELIIEIIQQTSDRMSHLKKEFLDKYDIHMSKKNLSEMLGKIMEKVAADVLTKKLGQKVKNAGSDREPDLTFTNITDEPYVEIKVTSTNNAWTGGEFSKRPFDYLLISWGENFDEYFVAFIHLEKKDWKSNMNHDFYGPSLEAKKVYEKKDKIIYLGSFETTKRGAIKIKREKIKDKKLADYSK